MSTLTSSMTPGLETKSTCQMYRVTAPVAPSSSHGVVPLPSQNDEPGLPVGASSSHSLIRGTDCGSRKIRRIPSINSMPSTSKPAG